MKRLLWIDFLDEEVGINYDICRSETKRKSENELWAISFYSNEMTFEIHYINKEFKEETKLCIFKHESLRL